MVVARGWGKGEWGLLFNEYRASIFKMKRVLETDCETI